MADQTDSFLREVQEDIRRERLVAIWSRYGTYIVAAAVLLVAAVGAYKFAEHRRIQSTEAAAARFEDAVRLATAGKQDAAEKAFAEIAGDAPRGYAALARIRATGLLAKAGKTGEAIAAYDALAKDASLDDLLRDYASLQAAMLRVDSADWTEMQNRLNDLTNDKNPWRASARELLGMAAYKAGKTEEARKAFSQLLSDRSTPPSLIERSQLMLGMLAEAELAGTKSGSAEADRQTTPKESAKPPEGAAPSTKK
jgi:hypothetical protein